MQSKKITLQDLELQAVVSSNKLLHFIEFKKDDGFELLIKPDTFTINKPPYENRYCMYYAGHEYLFAKQFGEFPKDRLLKKLDSLAPKKADYFSYEGKIYAGHIIINITATYGTEEEPVFRAVRHHVDYPGGKAAFNNYIRSKIPAGIKVAPTDSVLFYNILIKKDSLVHQVTPRDTTNTVFNLNIQAALKDTRGWTPFYMGGRAVNAYVDIFVRIKKDGTIDADYRR